MANRHWSLTATRRHLIEMLRRESLTVSELAERLDLTASAVRVHMTALEQLGLVQRDGVARGFNRPAAIYALAPGVDALLCGAYVPFVATLLGTIAEDLSGPEIEALMRRVGRRLAAGYGPLPGTLRQRAEAASGHLNDLGAVTEVEVEAGRLTIRGFDCPLAAAARHAPAVCRAMECFVSELVRAPVRERCDRRARPRCCFEILPPRTDERPKRRGAT